MGKVPRPLGNGLCYHIRSQCNNKAFRFETEDDFKIYLDLLAKVKRDFNLQIHAYNIMNTHSHIIGSTPGPYLLDEIMYHLNKTYSIDYNKRHERSGHFWMGPYRCSVIDSDEYALTCMRYIDRNPIRAGITKDPAEWSWSSYSYYGSGKTNDIITPLPSYLSLAGNSQKRYSFYKKFVLSIFPSDEKRDQERIKKELIRKLL